MLLSVLILLGLTTWIRGHKRKIWIIGQDLFNHLCNFIEDVVSWNVMDGAWKLFVGLILVLGQIVIGGITRLTDSGLSITEWEVIEGTIPPLNDEEWQITFDKYKVGAKHQYEIKNPDMTLSEFKFIYFWEWFHRFWARSMGMIFLIPFIFFLGKRYFSKMIVLRLGVVILLAATAAIMGWLMVDSGIQNTEEELVSEVLRTRVSAYKLIIHLLIATALIGYLWWTYLIVKHPKSLGLELPKIKKLGWLLVTMLSC